MVERVEMWIFDPLDFYTKKVIQISSYDIKKDEECNSKSTFESLEKNVQFKELDLVFVKKENTLIYSGIIESAEINCGKYKIICKDIINIFDEKIAISEEQYIKKNGLEDFIASQINVNYVIGPDYISSRNFIRVNVKSHTPINISVPTENRIYNLATFMINCKQNYDMEYDFRLNSQDEQLDINIYIQENKASKLIDLNNFKKDQIKEVYSSKVLSKVKVLTDSGEYCLYLKKDRTTTTNPNDQDILYGKATTIYTKKNEDAKQAALNQIRSNKYEHYFSWKDTKNFEIGEKVFIKTTKNEVIETYISAKEEQSNSQLKTYTCGRLRVKFIDKFLQEKYR